MSYASKESIQRLMYDGTSESSVCSAKHVIRGSLLDFLLVPEDGGSFSVADSKYSISGCIVDFSLLKKLLKIATDWRNSITLYILTNYFFLLLGQWPTLFLLFGWFTLAPVLLKCKQLTVSFGAIVYRLGQNFRSFFCVEKIFPFTSSFATIVFVFL